MSPVTPHNILRHEIIGLRARAVRSRDPTHRGISGLVVNETRNMLTLLRSGRKVMVPKNGTVFRFKLQDGTLVEVEGGRLLGNPENRLKARVRRW